MAAHKRYLPCTYLDPPAVREFVLQPSMSATSPERFLPSKLMFVLEFLQYKRKTPPGNRISLNFKEKVVVMGMGDQHPSDDGASAMGQLHLMGGH